MTVRATRPPTIPTVMAAIDAGARESINAARRVGLPVMRAALPVVSGRARRGTTARVKRTATGYGLEIAPTSRVRYPNGVSAVQVIGWLHNGTGIYGSRGRPIVPRRARAFRLPNGWSAGSLPGFPGVDYYGAAAPIASGLIEREFLHGADRAAALAEEAWS